MRLVLDTNIWLDLLVFNDPAAAPIKTAIASGHAQVFICAACEAELVRVLGYTLSGRSLTRNEQVAALERCRALALPVDGDSTAHAMEALPRCADPDDQMFLELARDCAASLLITKDKDLLALAARQLRPLPFRIVTPLEFEREVQTAR
jgi:putative PIN family toxin of toxin-antitoxin system